MAHELADDRESETGDALGKDPGEGDKLLLNRRNYVALGAAATAALLTGSAANGAASTGSEEANVYWTNFSEGEL